MFTWSHDARIHVTKNVTIFLSYSNFIVNTGIEPTTFLTPVRCSNHSTSRTQLAKRLRWVLHGSYVRHTYCLSLVFHTHACVEIRGLALAPNFPAMSHVCRVQKCWHDVVRNIGDVGAVFCQYTATHTVQQMNVGAECQRSECWHPNTK